MKRGLTCISSRLSFILEGEKPSRGVETLRKFGDIIRLWCRIDSSISLMVGDIVAYVQGASLKAIVAKTFWFFQLPDHQ